MKAFKGLKRNINGTLECRGFIYEPNKKYTFDGEIELCEQGFHACRELSDVWAYYPNNGKNVYWEVECKGEIKERDGYSKLVCSEIILLREVDTSNVAKFDYADFFSEGYARVKLKGKGYNFINRNGELIGNQWYDFTWDFNEGYAKVKLNGKNNWINHNGEIVFPKQWYDYVGSFNGGYAAVKLYGKGYNFINHNGEPISNQWYDVAWSFREGYAAVFNGKGWNYINRNSELIGNQWYDDAWSFNGGYAEVYLNGQWYQLRKDGVLCDYRIMQPIVEF